MDRVCNTCWRNSSIEKKITPRTKGIVIINPNNPTGALYPESLLKDVVRLAEKHDLIIFADEIYDRLVMDGKKHTSIASLAPESLCITFNGLSKSHLVAGYRVGWMSISGDKSNAKGYIDGIKLLSSMRLCSNVPAQSLIAPALEMNEETQALVAPGGRVYEQRNYIVDAINDIPGLSVVKPEAAFYCFPKLDTKKFEIIDDEKFALDVLREKHILFTHGGGFHWEQPDHFRIVYLPDMEVLKDSVKALREFLVDYKQARY